LSAYSAYIINAIQFVMKLRAARLQEAKMKNALQNQDASKESGAQPPNGVLA